MNILMSIAMFIQKVIAFISAGIFLLIFLVANLVTHISLPEHRIIPVHIKGSVVDVNTRKPIEYADVCIRYMIGGFDDAGTYTEQFKADEHGRFDIAMKKGGYFEVGVFKDGYYPFYSKAKTLFSNNVELYPIQNPQNLKIDVGHIGIKNKKTFGYNFSKSTATYDLDDADVILKLVGNRYKMCFNGLGGLCKNSKANELYNAPLAPLDGYKKEALLPTAYVNNTISYFKTADGKHYGKLSIGGAATSGYGIEYGFQYVYQPEEINRNLEIRYKRNVINDIFHHD